MKKIVVRAALLVCLPILAIAQDSRFEERHAYNARLANCPSRPSLEAAEARCEGSYDAGVSCPQTHGTDNIKVTCRDVTSGVELSFLGKAELVPPCRDRTRLCTYSERLFVRIGETEISVPKERFAECPNYHTLRPDSEDLQQYRGQLRFTNTLEKSRYVIEYLLNQNGVSGRLLIPMPEVRVGAEFAMLADLTQNGQRRILSCRNESIAWRLPKLRTISR